MLISALVSVVFLALVTGCASSRGFNRGTLRESIDQKIVVDNHEIAKALALKAQLPKPFKLAIHFSEPVNERYGTTAWRWTEAEKSQFVKLTEPLKASGEVSDVFVMTPDAVLTTASPGISGKPDAGSQLPALRLAAARHGADALLIVSGAKAVDTYSGDFAWTYVALVPMLFVPASHNDVLFMVRASLWDVRNQFLYMSAESESIQVEKAPLALLNEKPLLEKAKLEAVAKLSEEISAQVRGLKQEAPAPKSPSKKRRTRTAETGIDSKTPVL